MGSIAEITSITAHTEERREPEISELADLLLELEVLCLIFNKPVSDLHCKKEMCVPHACICLMHLQKRATKMHALYKRAWAYACDATPEPQGVLQLLPASLVPGTEESHKPEPAYLTFIDTCSSFLAQKMELQSINVKLCSVEGTEYQFSSLTKDFIFFTNNSVFDLVVEIWETLHRRELNKSLLKDVVFQAGLWQLEQRPCRLSVNMLWSEKKAKTENVFLVITA
ncbi:hypothetical protein EK904_009726 [Melospiza melodia maxima]|nr:hypothetical protein EK904_009726 [Melospiza melodia maxima]